MRTCLARDGTGLSEVDKVVLSTSSRTGGMEVEPKFSFLFLVGLSFFEKIFFLYKTSVPCAMDHGYHGNAVFCSDLLVQNQCI